MRSPPRDLDLQRVRDALFEGWGVTGASMEYLPIGGGSHHWMVIGEDDDRHFLTVDDLDNKEWLGPDRKAVLHGLENALDTSSALRHRAGLDFVVAPIAGKDGRLLRQLAPRYTLSVFPFLSGLSFEFGSYTDPSLRDQALDLIVALHRATEIVRSCAPSHVPRYGGQEVLAAFLAQPDVQWDGGPFSEPARRLLVQHTSELSRLAKSFDQLVAATGPQRANGVVTHGEPHPANLMSLPNGRLALIDWDTVALAPPERDLSLITLPSGGGFERYEKAAGRPVHSAVILLYRLRWYLDDIASAARLFRGRHRDTPDTQGWFEGLAPHLEELPTWLSHLGEVLRGGQCS